MDKDKVSLKEVIKWRGPNCSVVLPALQRGLVWKPGQIELIWDSILRNFPIGTLMLSTYLEGAGNRFLGTKAIVWQRYNEPPKYSLLDGQQRVFSISLATHDPWENDEGLPVLWVDLGLEDEQSEGRRKYIFHLVTKSHPWGFSHAVPGGKLGLAKYRIAIEEFKKVFEAENLSSKEFNKEKLSLSNVWPWDAKVPIPVCKIIKEIEIGNENPGEIWNSIRKTVESLPFFKSEVFKAKLDNPINLDLIEKLLAAYKYYSLPVVKYDLNGLSSYSEHSFELEELFVRINAGGTRLEGEELIYSILKSIEPKVLEVVEAVEKKTDQLISPSRLVMLALRIALMDKQKSKENMLPGVPSVGEFRRLMINSEFREKFIGFINEKKFQKLIDQSIKILQLNLNKEYGLPPYLISSIAKKSQDVYLLLLCLLKENPVLLEKNQKNLIGLLTAIHWFSEDKGRCVRELWGEFVRDGEIKPSIAENPYDQRIWLVLPLICPKMIKNTMEEVLGEIIEKNEWDCGREKLISLISNKMRRKNEKSEIFEKGVEGLLKRLFDTREMLVYAQRSFLNEKFKNYGLVAVDQYDDYYRPWDYDHIHPYFYVLHDKKGKIPQIIKETHSTNGNYRAWPLEDNRSDQNAPPAQKFRPLRVRSKKIKDSFINFSSIKMWVRSTPFGDKEANWPRYYLGEAQYQRERVNLLKAIMFRMIDIYEEWYLELIKSNSFVLKD